MLGLPVPCFPIEQGLQNNTLRSISPSTVPVSRHSAREIAWQEGEKNSSGSMRSSAGCRYCAGIPSSAHTGTAEGPLP